MNQDADPTVALSLILSRYVSLTNESGSKELAIRVVTSGREHGSERAKPFFMGIAGGLDKYREAAGADRFTLEFTQDNTAGVVAREYRSGKVTFILRIPGYYEMLIM